MEDIGNITLQASYLVCANSLRREAKLCDIILYVQGRMGAMVGYPAHKLLLISASKYFKLLFEREDLRNYCHFPHLSEEGVFAVLDIIYGREIRQETNLDDALMAARFLQVDCAVDILEKKKTEKLTQARASPEPPRRPSSRDKFTSIKRKSETPIKERPEKQRTMSTSSQPADHVTRQSHYKTVPRDEDHNLNSPLNQPSHSEDSSYSCSGGGVGMEQTGTDSAYELDLSQVKKEPDVDLTVDDSDDHDLSQLGFGHGQEATSFEGHSFGDIKTDNEGNMNLYGATSQSDNMYSSAGDMSGMAPGGAFTQDNSQMGSPGGAPIYSPSRRRFLFPSTQRRQSLARSDDLRYMCKICGMKFRYSGNRNKHLMTHSQERPFECSVCGKKFKLRQHLKIHSVTHI